MPTYEALTARTKRPSIYANAAGLGADLLVPSGGNVDA